MLKRILHRLTRKMERSLQITTAAYMHEIIDTSTGAALRFCGTAADEPVSRRCAA